MTRILGIDPGPSVSGVVVLGLYGVEFADNMANDELREQMRSGEAFGRVSHVACEMIESFGMAVGAEVFRTCVEVGRYVECCQYVVCEPDNVLLVTRREVKLHLCNSARAKDPNVRQALIDLIGPPGTKKEPGPTYGVKKHAWAALGVAVTAQAKLHGIEAQGRAA